MGNNWNTIVGVVILALVAVCSAEFGKPCNESLPQSEIYCFGDLLRTVQKAKLPNNGLDQKTFVDRPLKYEPQTVIAAFKALNIVGDNLTEEQKTRLAQFVEDNFDRNGTELENWEPEDWTENPAFLTQIANEDLRNWAAELHSFWHELGRKIKEDVKVNDTRHSMYYVSHPVIFPGGRFKEFYYWDSYWIQRGLLVSNMTTTVKGMIENFMEMVDMLGFIPNGGRIYYQRSQPPLLSAMVDSYYEETGDLEFIKLHINTLIKEYDFFKTHRTVKFLINETEYEMAHYNVELTDPRPESFSEDYDLVQGMNGTDEEKELMYANLKSGAESGWDFSSRWFVLPEGESLIDGDLTHTKTRDIIPVDLNSFLYWTASIIAKFCDLIKDSTVCDANIYHEEAKQRKENIYDVLWDEDAGTWYDYDFVRGQKRRHFYPTNLAPLWVQAVHDDLQAIAKRSVNYLQLSGAANFPGGIPTSMLQTGLQWDFPNGWAPLNHLVVEALERTNETSAQKLAFELADKWIKSNHLAYLQTENMFEKYDVTYVGSAGSGGEYEVVIGFGWSNGVVLDFLMKYGDRLTPVPNLPTPKPSTSETGSTTSTTSTTPQSTTSSAITNIGRSTWVVILPFIAIVLKYRVL